MNHSPHLPGNPHARNLTSTGYTTETPEYAAACQVEALLALAFEIRTLIMLEHPHIEHETVTKRMKDSLE